MEAWTPVVVVKVVELTARGRASRGKPVGGLGDNSLSTYAMQFVN